VLTNGGVDSHVGVVHTDVTVVNGESHYETRDGDKAEEVESRVEHCTPTTKHCPQALANNTT
jgi:hypothetical protein